MNVNSREQLIDNRQLSAYVLQEMDDASCTYPDRGNDAEEVLWSKDVQDSAILMKQHLAGVKIDYTGLAAASS